MLRQSVIVMAAKNITHTANAHLGRWRKTSTYRKFAKYSHCNDQTGPLSGLVSAQPRMSIEAGMGMMVKHQNMASSNVYQGVSLIRGNEVHMPK